MFATSSYQLRCTFHLLRLPYSLLAFCRDLELFGSSQENPHKSAKVSRSGIIFNFKRKSKQSWSAATSCKSHNFLSLMGLQDKCNYLLNSGLISSLHKRTIANSWLVSPNTEASEYVNLWSLEETVPLLIYDATYWRSLPVGRQPHPATWTPRCLTEETI